MLTGIAVKRCAIWCVLDKMDGSYSLTEVIEEQIKMLALHGYPVEVWMLADWKLADDPRAQRLLAEFPGQGIRFLPIVPRLRLYDYNDHERSPDSYADEKDPNPSFHGKVVELCEALAPRLGEVDCVLTHDILFQTWYLPHGKACRVLADFHPEVRWFHWQHSGPSARPVPVPPQPYSSRFFAMPRSAFIYPNEDPREVERVAAMRGLFPTQIAFVPNTRDILEYLDVPPLVKSYVRRTGLLDADLLLTIPSRLDEGKQPKKALMFLWALRAAGVDARLIWCAAYANPEQPKNQEYLHELRQFAYGLGLHGSLVHFTSEEREWADYMPRDCVRAFQQIADLLVLPSLSEAHSLVAMEAALCRQTLVLNEDFQPMSGWFPQGSTRPVQFGSRLQTTIYHPTGRPEDASRDEELRYYYGEAQKLIHWLDYGNLPAFRFQRQKRNLGYVFKHHLERLLWSI